MLILGVVGGCGGGGGGAGTPDPDSGEPGGEPDAPMNIDAGADPDAGQDPPDAAVPDARISFVCGNGLLEEGEECDDHDLAPGDGCDGSCLLENGWTCPVAGLPCEATECGDSIVAGFEACDDGNDQNGDGCNASCVLEDGYQCDVPGSPCVETTCGDTVVEGTEECDDGNNDLGDGCDPLCRREPICTAGTCQAFCGDGIRLDSEACDDGNLRDGDGCSSDCAIEEGFTCDDIVDNQPSSVAIPIVLRDFRGFDLPDGHVDFEHENGDDEGIVEVDLGADGKPVYAGQAGNPSTHGADAFDQWYRDTPGENITVVDQLVLSQTSAGTYVYDDQAFFPLDQRGFVAAGQEDLRRDGDGVDRNFHFTSALHYWFEYEGDEVLEFRGDDDVWVFVNGQLAIDLGGVHGAKDGSITLDGDAATTFGLTVGGVYEVAVFQAERHTERSSYKLTLHNFQTVFSGCESECGDGIRTPLEVCDDGMNNGEYGSCTADCQGYGPRCGDGEVQEMYETCDDANDEPNDGCHACQIVSDPE